MNSYIIRVKNNLGGWSQTVIHADNQWQAKQLAEGMYGAGNVTVVGESR